MKEKLTGKFFITLFIGVILLFISSSLGDKIINEPLWLILLVFFLSAIITYGLVKKFFTINNEEKKRNSRQFLFSGNYLAEYCSGRSPLYFSTHPVQYGNGCKHPSGKNRSV
jgi:hypothetical protein